MVCAACLICNPIYSPFAQDTRGCSLASRVHTCKGQSETCCVIELILAMLLQLDAAVFQAGALCGWGALLASVELTCIE